MIYAINEHLIRNMTLGAPRVGVWRADVTIESNVTVTGPVELKIGTQTWTGTAYQQDTWLGTRSLRIVGGKTNGFIKYLNPAFYSGTTLRDVVADAVAQAGESLSSTSDALGDSLTFWSRSRSLAGFEMDRLCQLNSWRVLPDGTTFVGREKWPTIATPADVGVTKYWVTELMQEVVWAQPILPGAVWDGRKIDRIQFVLDGEKTRGKVYFASEVPT